MGRKRKAVSQSGDIQDLRRDYHRHEETEDVPEHLQKSVQQLYLTRIRG